MPSKVARSLWNSGSMSRSKLTGSKRIIRRGPDSRGRTKLNPPLAATYIWQSKMWVGVSTLVLPDETDDGTLDLDGRAGLDDDGIHGGVRRLQADVAFFLKVALEGGFPAVDKRDDHLAV